MSQHATKTTADATTTTSPAVTTQAGGASEFSLDGFLATPPTGAPPQVLALVGTTITGEGKFAYLVESGGTFRVTAMPPGTPPDVMGRPIRPDNEYKDAWQALCDQIVAKAPPKPASVTPAVTATKQASAPSIGTVVLDGIASVGAAIAAPFQSAVERGSQLFESMFGDEAAAPELAAPEPEESTGAPSPVASTKQDNLAKAIELAGENGLDQGYSLTPKDGGTKVKTDIFSGNAQNLTTLNCGQFTAATLAEAGFDLNMEYVDPGSGIPVAYADGSAKEKGESVTFVTAWMLVNNQPEAEGAILDAQQSKAELISGEDCASYTLATNVKQNDKFEIADGTKPPPAKQPGQRSQFLLSRATEFAGRSAKHGESFGAGAVAQLFGGELVPDLAKRMPGDIQQRLATNQDGTFGHTGHSSTVYAVKGTGTCYFDQNDATTPQPAKQPTAAGWYTGEWTIGPTTEPRHVSQFSASEVQLIDANVVGDKNQHGERRDQAVDIGAFKTPEAGQQESTGRLPTSKWLGWKDGKVAAKDPQPL